MMSKRQEAFRADYRQRVRTPMRLGASTRDGFRSWDDVENDASRFPELGAELDATGRVRTGRVGSAECRLMRQRDAVDFAAEWLDRRASL